MILFSPSSRLYSHALWLSTTLFSSFLLLSGCQSVTSTTAKMNATINNAPIHTKTASNTLLTPSNLTPAVQSVIGDYETEHGEQHYQDNSSIGVMVRPFGDADIDIKIRAQGDRNQPSCRFNGRATLMGQDQTHGVIFQTIANNSVTFLQFKDGKLTIDSPNKTALNSLCSGGATLAGNYQKLLGGLTLSS